MNPGMGWAGTFVSQGWKDAFVGAFEMRQYSRAAVMQSIHK